MIIEPIQADDIAAVAAIYGHHVLHGTASFELAPPSEAEMAERIAKVTASGWPWLVARAACGAEAGAVLGYAYASQFRDRPAYRFACENSIYIRHDRRGQGVGKALLDALLGAAEACGFRQMIAVIGGGEPASIALHGAAGFLHAGRMQSIGRKHGRWLDTVYMQRALGPGDNAAPAAEPG